MNPFDIPLGLDLSRNAFHFPVAEGQGSSYYNPLADLVVVSPVDSEFWSGVLLSLETAHRKYAFVPILCYMRYVACYMYSNIRALSEDSDGLIDLHIPGFKGIPIMETTQDIIDMLWATTAPVHEIWSLFETVGAMRNSNVPSSQVTEWEQSALNHHEREIPGFSELYSLFNGALRRLGRDYAGVLVQMALSPPWTKRISGSEGVARSIWKALRSGWAFSPTARLEGLIHVVEDCWHLDIASWMPGDVQRYLNNEFVLTFAPELTGRGSVAWCMPWDNTCFLKAHARFASGNTFIENMLGVYRLMCAGNRRAFGEGVVDTSNEPRDGSLPSARRPTFYCQGSQLFPFQAKTPYHFELLLMEDIRGQLLSGSGLRCFMDGWCGNSPKECTWAKVLGGLWRKTCDCSPCLSWKRPHCLDGLEHGGEAAGYRENMGDCAR